jgi:hypothetical protein
LRLFGIRHQGGANNSAEDSERDQDEIWRGIILPPLKALEKHSRKQRQAKDETNISEPMCAARVRAGREQIEGEDDRDLGEREMRRGGESRSGGPEKAEYERRHQAFNHQPGVRHVRIRDRGAKIVEHPERYSEEPEQGAGRKENPEGLLANLRERAGPSALNVRWRRFHVCNISGATPASNFCVVKAKLRVSPIACALTLHREGNRTGGDNQCPAQ